MKSRRPALRLRRTIQTLYRRLAQTRHHHHHTRLAAVVGEGGDPVSLAVSAQDGLETECGMEIGDIVVTVRATRLNTPTTKDFKTATTLAGLLPPTHAVLQSLRADHRPTPEVLERELLLDSAAQLADNFLHFLLYDVLLLFAQFC